jgi:hypothetical protein
MRRIKLTEYIHVNYPKRIMIPCFWEVLGDHDEAFVSQICGFMTVYNNPYDFQAYFQIQADFNGKNWRSYQITVRNFS